MSSDQSLNTLSELLMRKLNHELDNEAHARLKGWLANDAEARQYYVEFMALNAHLRKQRVVSAAPLNIDLSKDRPSDAESLSEWLNKPGLEEAETSEPHSEHVNEIRRIADERLHLFLEEQEEMRRQQALYERDRSTSLLLERLYCAAQRIVTTATWLMRNALRLTALAAVVLLGLALVQYALRHRIVATLDEAVHARWETPPTDANLYPGPMVLKEGFAKLTFKQGAEVILQAPCAFDLASENKMVLHHGMVTAQVPKQAHGFAIKTPQSTVTDFGTEFGVQVQASAASEVHVFDGLVKVRTETQPQARDVPQGKAAVISQSGKMDINALNTRTKLFARDVPEPNAFGIPNKRLDLADVAGGGSGFGTGKRYAGIDPATGQTVLTYRSQQRTGGTGYVEVPSLPFVDCVFVPLAEGGLMPVSTARHHFDFPAGGGSWFVEIAYAGEAKYRKLPHDSLMLDGQDYGTATHPALLMHANVGITFDLDAMRASLAGSRIKRFTSVCGINNRVQKTKTPDAIVYVLVDGQVRSYEKIQLPNVLAVKIGVDLREDERFLTLVCLAGTANYGDWTLFGVPALELEGVVE